MDKNLETTANKVRNIERFSDPDVWRKDVPWKILLQSNQNM